MSKVFNKMHECYAKLYFLDITRTTNVVRIISNVFFNEWIDESMNELINQQSISRTAHMPLKIIFSTKGLCQLYNLVWQILNINVLT